MIKKHEIARARDAYAEWKKAGEFLLLTGDPQKLMDFADRQGEFLATLTQTRREQNPRLNTVSMFDIIADMVKEWPELKVIDSP